MSQYPFSAGSRLDQPEPHLADARSVALRTIIGPGGALSVQSCDTEDMSRHVEAWADLVARSLEPNVFMEPAFALSAAQHFAPSQLPRFLLVWAESRRHGPTLIGLCAVQEHRFGPKVTSAWTHQQATLSAPLLDRARAGDALDALLGALERRRPGSAGLLMTGLPRDGALMRLMQGSDRRIAVLEQRTRAILRGADSQAEALAPKRAKELRRQRRRLSEGGDLVLRSAHGADAVRVAAERFLELEARGWKGANGTALLGCPRLATFTRTMTRLLAREGKCSIHSLERDGEPLAMGIVLTSGDRAYFWKTAYDEAQARLSPGKQFTQLLSAEISADPRVALTDSCAVPDHPMIDRLWRDRMIVADVLVGLPAVPVRTFERAVRHLSLWRWCRQGLKAALHGGRRLLGR